MVQNKNTNCISHFFILLFIYFLWWCYSCYTNFWRYNLQFSTMRFLCFWVFFFRRLKMKFFSSGCSHTIYLNWQPVISLLIFFWFEKIQQINQVTFTAQKMKFSIKYFFSKYSQIRSFPQSHLLKKVLIENFFLCAVFIISSQH